MRANLGAAVYGAITVGVLLAAESARRETYAGTVGAVVVAMALYWLAHAYTEHVSVRARDGKPFAARDLLDTMLHELWILAGAALPLVAVLISWAVGAGLASAIDSASWAAAGAIVIIEIVAGAQAELTGAALALQAAVGTALGLLVLALRLLLH
jgi:hypothetical protein